MNQYHYAQRSEAGSVACTLISLLAVSAWRSHKDNDFIAGWLQQDAAQPAAWTACMREGARLMHLYLRDVVSKQQEELLLPMDQFCLPDEVCEVLMAGRLKNSKDAGWCRLRELAKEARWERLACGTSLRAAIELLCGHRLSLASHQEAAYILVSGNKSSLCIACSHSACSALHCGLPLLLCHGDGELRQLPLPRPTRTGGLHVSRRSGCTLQTRAAQPPVCSRLYSAHTGQVLLPARSHAVDTHHHVLDCNLTDCIVLQA